MKSRNNQQYRFGKKRKKIRKEAYSVTLDLDVVAKAVSLDDEANFSRYVGKALKHYNKYLENKNT